MAHRPLSTIATGLVLGLLAPGGPSMAAEPIPARAIDLSGYVQTFAETFVHFDVSAWGPGTRWIAHTPWHGDFGDATFVDPTPGFPFQTGTGMLRIEARKTLEGKWQSGLIASRGPRGSGDIGGFAQKYGYFEIETKLPPGSGTWPAFWLSGVDSKPGAEIDVLEYYGHAPDGYHANVHVWYDGKQTFGDGKIVPIAPGQATDSFNRYGVDVEPDWVTFYFNRREVWRTPTRPEYRQAMFMLVDLALGSGWPIDKTPNPSFMYVRSITAYRKRSDSPLPTAGDRS